MKKKKIFSLVTCLLLVFSMIVPATAYDTEEDFLDSEEVVTFSIDDMTEIEDGVYSIDIPLDTNVVINEGIYSTYGDCSYQFITTLNAKYYSSTSTLQTAVTVSRTVGTGLIKSISATLGYRQYKNDGTIVQSSSADESETVIVPRSTRTLSHDFKWVYFNDSTGYITLSASGSFTLVDGYGTFGGSNNSVTVID